MAALAVAAISALPVVAIVAAALESGWGQAAAAIWRPRVAELLLNTVSLVVLTTSATLVIGIGAAWIVERTTIPGARWWRVALVAPLAVPAFVNSYAWLTVRPSMSGLGGAVLITTLSYFPFVFLPTGALLRSLDRSWEDSARSLGLSAWATFWRVVLPQLRPGIVGGALLVALHLLAEFGVLAMLRYPTFTTAILDQYGAAFDRTGASVLALVLLSLCAAVLTLEYLARGRRHHARVGSGVAARAERQALGRWRLPVGAFLLALVVLSLGVPMASITRWLVTGSGESDAGAGPVLVALAATVGLALVTGLATTLAAFPVAVLLRRHHSVLTTSIERITYLASSLPGVVVALALVSLAITWASGLYQTSTLLVLAYVILFLPRAVVSIRAALAHAPDSLLEAARSLGATPFQATRRVLVPLIAPGLLGGFAMVFIATSTELTATLILAPTGTTTLATGFWAASDSLDYAGAAPFALAMVLVSTPITWLLLHRREDLAQ